MKTVTQQAALASSSKPILKALSASQRKELLYIIADALVSETPSILNANSHDIESGKAAGLSDALIDRLLLTEERIQGMSASIRSIADLDDPIGTSLDSWTQPNGLHIEKIRVPLGCIGMIYEARPNVTADAIALAIKTSNAVVLRGSQSAYQTNLAITEACKKCIIQQYQSADFIQLLEDTNRSSVREFIQLNDYLDLVIPRGSATLIQHVVQHATVPTIETGVGNCHVYIDASCDLKKALLIADNAKTHRPSVCNACESILVHKDIAHDFLTQLAPIFATKNVEIRGCSVTQSILHQITAVKDEDWDTEFLDLIVSIKVVDSTADAIEHIKHHGSHHTEAIVAENPDAIHAFKTQVDASAIIINASTRFTDGGEFGFGAEIGISTQKLHARGPMGINELTSYTYIVTGQGQIRK